MRGGAPERGVLASTGQLSDIIVMKGLLIKQCVSYIKCMWLTGMGRPVEVASRVQRLKATVWLAEGFPLSLQEQIMPIIDLMVFKFFF